MRRKQLGIFVLLLAASVCATASTAQLTDLNVAAQGNVTTLTVHASGPFTHNEYRPTDNLLLVDLAGVAPAHFSNSMKDVNAPGVSSYHVLNYKGAGGAEVTRVELALAPGAVINIADVQNGLAVKVTNSEAAAEVKATSKPAATAPAKAAEAPATAATPKATAMAPARPGRLVTVERVGVMRGKDGLEVEIAGNGAMTAKAMKLSSPDRVVLDIANAAPAHRMAPIAVNSPDVKAVRVGRYQAQPPVTRVVVDLAAAHEYEVIPAGNKLTLKLHGATATAPAALPIKTASPPLVLAHSATPAASQNAAEGKIAEAKPAAAESAAPPKDAIPAPQPPTQVVQAAARFSAPAEVPAYSSNGRASSASASMRPKMMNAAMQAPAAPAAAPAGGVGVQSASQSCIRERYSGEPVSVNLKDVDLKDFFRLIHEISGLNIVLDPNVHGTLTLVLDDVPWDQALVIVLKNNGLDCDLQGNVLRIATVDTLRHEAESVRAKEEAQALAVPPVTYTHYLSYAHSKDVVPTVKKFLSARGDVIADDRTNSLIIQDIPGVIPRIQQLLLQLDQKVQQVEIEARVVAATRNFARDIGVQLGFGWGNGVNTAVGGASAVGTSPAIVTGLTPKYFTLGNSIPLFSNLPAVGPNGGITVTNATNTYRLDFILTAAENRGLLKLLSRPRVVTQNNSQALVRQGVQIPVVTAAQLGGPPTVTMVQAFLRLTVTPQITAEKTIFLTIDVENTTPDFGNAINGNPSLLTQQASTNVLVNDGGTVMIGGVIQTKNSVNITQVPLLGSIPVFGNLFKRRAVSTSTQELIFFITPKIIQT